MNAIQTVAEALSLDSIATEELLVAALVNETEMSRITPGHAGIPFQLAAPAGTEVVILEVDGELSGYLPHMGSVYYVELSFSEIDPDC